MHRKNITEKIIDFAILDNIQKYLTTFSKHFLKLLISRNLDNPIKIQKFLNPKITDLQNPFIIHDMHKAVIRVQKAISNNENIFIYGDKDVDGQSSISLLKSALKEYGLNVDYYIPVDEGYGVHKSIVSTLLKKNINLFITVDCGISNKDEIEFIKNNGIDVIVMDHHEVVGDIPKADAVVDPKIDTVFYEDICDSKSLKNLAGCGVVFYFVWALKISYSQYFDKKFLVLDLETTGLNSSSDKILEIGAVVLKNGIIENRFQTYIKQDLDIPKYITKINGISNETVKNSPDENTAIDNFLEFIDKNDPYCFVVHNADFDINFLKNSVNKKINLYFEKKQILDTLEISRKLYPNESHKLENLARKFCLSTDFHRALADAEITAKIYWNILMKDDFIIQDFFKRYVAFSALGTISDIMPLLNENRFLVKYGILGLKKDSILSLKLFLDEMIGENKFLTAKYIAWNITPFLNSAGRMGKPYLGVEYLCSDEEKEILSLREEISDLNMNRRSIQQRDEKTANKILKNQGIQFENFIFVYSETFEKNVTGIVASNIVKKHNKVVFVASENGERTTGSVRAPKGYNYNVVSILEKAGDVLEKFGGHKLAGGFTLNTKNIANFEKKLIDIFTSETIIGENTNDIEVDLILNSDDLTDNFFKEILLMEPFGEANPHPIFLFENIKFVDFGFMGSKKEHFKGKIRLKDLNFIEVIGWNMRQNFVRRSNEENIFSFIAHVEKDFYNGEERIRLNIQEMIE